MKILLLLLFSFLTVIGKSQFVEKVYLKDSVTTYTGWIVEQVPQEYLKMLRLRERDTIRIASGDIWKIVRVIDKKVSDNPFVVQRSGRSQAIFAELLGSSLLYSLNYDTRIKKGKRNGWGLRTGIGTISLSAVDSVNHLKGTISVTNIPIETNYLVGKNRSALELGAGATLLLANLKHLTSNETYINQLDEPLRAFEVAVTSTVGYRYTSLNNGFMFRVTVNPFLFNGAFSWTAGLSIGYHFQRK